MELLVGFVIALAISLTGVGAGSMTAPALMVLLRVPPATAVGTALMFGAVVKCASAPVYMLRRNVNWRVLSLMLGGGIPGVLAGGFALNHLKSKSYNSALYLALGSVIAVTAAFHLYRVFRPAVANRSASRTRWLPWLTLPIGAEVGFSSAGAGALGSLLLVTVTPLSTAEIVGTDLCFGLGVSFVGSVIQAGAGNYDAFLLLKLIAGGLCGVACGTMLSGRIAQRPLRVCLLVALIALGIQLASRSNQPPKLLLRAWSGVSRHTQSGTETVVNWVERSPLKLSAPTCVNWLRRSIQISPPISVQRLQKLKSSLRYVPVSSTKQLNSA